MMRTIICLILAVLLAAFPSFVASAAEGPDVLPDAECVTRGRLGNGLTYYIVKDDGSRGTADLFLVRKRPVQCADVPDEAPMGAFRRTYSFGEGRAAAFLARSGAALGTGTDARKFPDGTVAYGIKRLPVSAAPVLDSALLLLVNIASDSLKLPFSMQSIVVSGDVDPATVAGRLSLIAMYEPARDCGSLPDTCRSGNGPLPEPVYVFNDVPYTDVSVSFSIDTLPAGLRNTVVPVIGSRMGLYAGKLLDRRLELSADISGVSLLDCSVSMKDGLETGTGHDVFEVSVSVPGGQEREALGMIENVLCGLARHGFSVEEYRMADLSFQGGVWTEKEPAYREYARRCISNFLYGTSLASPDMEMEYLLSRPIGDSSGCRYLNRYVSAILKSPYTVSVTGDFPDGGRSGAEHGFSITRESSGCPGADSCIAAAYREDTLRVLPSGTRTGTRPVKKESLTGTPVLHFSNGLKIYYKESESGRSVRFSVFYKGGFAQNPRLGPGEGAFYSDLMKVDSVAGMKYRDFERLLTEHGIAMDYRFDRNCIEISGKSPVASLPFLWSALNAVMNDRRPDPEGFADYVRKESLMLEYAGEEGRKRFVADTLDALLHPFSIYSGRKRLRSLETLDYEECSSFISERLAQTGNAVFAFMSPLSADGFREACAANAGWFRAKKRVRLVDYDAAYGTFAGNMVSDISLDEALGADARTGTRKVLVASYAMPCGYDAGNLYLAKVSAKVLERALNEVLARYSVSVSVDCVFDTPPQEYCYVSYSVRLPENTNMTEFMFDINAVNKSLKNPSSGLVGWAKEIVMNEVSSAFVSGEAWFGIIRDRYVFNKNTYSHYEKIISGIAPEEVGDFIKKLLDGGCVELYVKGLD